MNINEAIKYISNYKWNQSKPGLIRIKELCERLGNPQKNLKCIHVAGTNGKGSTCAYISQILIEAGYKTGLFSSPSIIDFNDRIKINNGAISSEDLVACTLIVKAEAEKMTDHPTEFELLTAISFVYFKLAACDIVVVEVGMGGRLDSTNVLEADEVLCSVITRIGLDHTNFLGNNLEDIRKEKEGIIKNRVPVVHYKYVDSGCVKDRYRIFEYKQLKYKTRLLGSYQPSNAAMAIDVAKILRIKQNFIYAGIKNAKLLGRFDIVSKNPFFVIDGSHNPQGIYSLCDSLLDVFGNRKFIFVIGVLKDKDYVSIANIIEDIAKSIYVITPQNSRALTSDEFVKYFKSAKCFKEVDTCLEEAFKSANFDDVICCCGSLYSVKKLYNWANNFFKN